MPPEKFLERGSVMTDLRNLKEFDEFYEVINFIDLDGDVQQNLSKLTEAFAVALLEKK